MLGRIVLLVAIAIAVIYVLRARRQLAVLAQQIRDLRAHALKPVTYRPVGSPELADELSAATAQAEKAGFTMLGDYLEESEVREGMPMRWFVDARGTTFGWMSPFEVRGKREIVLVLMSHELASQTITARAPKASALMRPPFVHAQTVAMDTSFKDTVAKHREHANLDDETRGFVPVKTFEQLSHELERMRGKVITWRESQPDDELLDADLRTLLGAQYKRLASAMRRRLAS
ncbi:MAG TPA: hypothetical protein VFV99_25660 [Kofleriaceae bacterium]|nr:hypothetical protein [Kofleriaceae bacterium]